MDKCRIPVQTPESRALSARRPKGQAGGMALAALLLAAGSPASAGDLETMPIGDYVCEMPGDVTGPTGLHRPDEDFTVVTASSYRSGEEMGSYLLTGGQLIMTSGRLQGARYRRQSEGFVRKLDAQGSPSDLRCVRRKANNR